LIKKLKEEQAHALADKEKEVMFFLLIFKHFLNSGYFELDSS
jgi:hypothetical protein